MKCTIIMDFIRQIQALNNLKNESLELAVIVDKDPKTIKIGLHSGTGNFLMGNIYPEEIQKITISIYNFY